MLPTLFVRTGLAVAISLVLAGTAGAQGTSAPMPPVTKAHPRIYATAADFDRLEKLGAIQGPGVFPAAGSIRFELYPVSKGPSDLDNAVIFGQNSYNGPIANGVRFSYTKDADGLFLAVALYGSDGKYQAGFAERPLNANGSNTISISFDRAKLSVVLNVNDSIQTKTLDKEWSLSGQQFNFQGHRGDRIANFSVTDNATGKVTWSSAAIDPEVNLSWQAYLKAAMVRATILADCTASSAAECTPTQGGRKEITEVARHLALVYRYTGNADILKAIRKHIDLIKQAGLDTGGEWSMSGRVGALALYYDWLYATLNQDERDAIAERIKQTIRADRLWSSTVNQNDDLIYSVCGAQPLATGILDCATKPVYTNWARYPKSAAASVSEMYISGHPASAATLVATALLAIVEQGDTPKHNDVLPMLDTIYQHYAQGYLPARELYTVDGGNHMAFSYGGSSGGDMADRLIMWDRALSGASGLSLRSLGKLIYPYIYGIRADGSFPARGDNFLTRSTGEMIASMALAAEIPNPDAGTAGQKPMIPDPVAATFYRNSVDGPGARGNQSLLWQRLLYKQTAVSATALPASLSRHFAVAGHVLIRNTWDNATNALLEFKSTSFISENHQHLDQNSFSLYYKAPLLLDSGLYDNYLTTHWKNYYQRTIAHNAIVVYDQAQKFLYQNKETDEWSKDGGQWYGNRPIYPTVEEAFQPGGSNRLDGVTGFEDGDDYVYVAGNASKAYAGQTGGQYTVDQQSGMQRSIVYLRRPAGRYGVATPPLVLVYDNVRAKLAATSLLHMAAPPAGDQTASPIPNEPGRYLFGNGAGIFTVRNDKGMVTVQTLLPKPATRVVKLSGGKGPDSCDQFKKIRENGVDVEKITGKEPDCRFLVRAPSGNWVNYPPQAASSGGDVDLLKDDAPDVGAWRLEISDSATAAAAPNAAGYTPQYFLNALHVADSDDRKEAATLSDPVTLLAQQGYETTAVKVDSNMLVVFNGGSTPLTTLKWQPDGFAGKTLLLGLSKNGCYVLNRSAPMWELKGVNSGCTHTSSANGVLVLQP